MTRRRLLCGNDEDAEKTTRRLLKGFGWKDMIDLGEITASRATESYLPLWLALYRAGKPNFNIKVIR